MITRCTGLAEPLNYVVLRCTFATALQKGFKARWMGVGSERRAAPVHPLLFGKLAGAIAQYKLPLALRTPGRLRIELCGAIRRLA
jgi:hypothetical protein